VAPWNLDVHSLRLADLEPARADPVPLELLIPTVGVRAAIVPVGVEPGGAMEIPEDVATVGWYRFGSSPGRPGSALLVGHVDSRVYGPGVFFRLSELDPGDVVRVHVTKRRWESFEVVSRNLVPKEQLPAAIFARRGDAVLTLITCGGGFDQAAGRYTHNVVISAVALA
jgi:sortase (surface protein transpeptidase)